MPEINSIVGAIVIANVATIITVIGAVVRGTWFMSKLDSRVEYAQATAVRAHRRISAITGDPNGHD